MIMFVVDSVELCIICVTSGRLPREEFCLGVYEQMHDLIGPKEQEIRVLVGFQINSKPNILNMIQHDLLVDRPIYQ